MKSPPPSRPTTPTTTTTSQPRRKLQRQRPRGVAGKSSSCYIGFLLCLVVVSLTNGVWNSIHQDVVREDGADWLTHHSQSESKSKPWASFPIVNAADDDDENGPMSDKLTTKSLITEPEDEEEESEKVTLDRQEDENATAESLAETKSPSVDPKSELKTTAATQNLRQNLATVSTPSDPDTTKPGTLQNSNKPDETATTTTSLISPKIHNSTTMIWPTPKTPPESTSKTPLVVVIVMSARANVELRHAIRESWASGHAVYFLIGTSCPYSKSQRDFALTCEAGDNSSVTVHDEWYQRRLQFEDEILQEEQGLYRDMLWTPDPESYRGLPHKLKEAYEWVVTNTRAKWIVKADDDMIVRVGSLEVWLSQFNHKDPTVIGKIMYRDMVARKGKWAETTYKQSFYPYFPLGSCGHVVSRSVAKYVAKNKESLVEYQGEDTSLGIWLNESPLQEKVVWIKTETFTNNRKCEDPNTFVVGHNFAPDEIRNCFKKVGDEVEPVP